MRTDELIASLASEAGRRRTPMPTVWMLVLGAAVLLAAAVFFATLGVRPDFAEALAAPAFLLKFAITLAIAVTAMLVLARLARPGSMSRAAWSLLLVGPLLLLGAVGLELATRAPEQWSMLAQGKNSLICLTYIPLIGLGPLALLLAGLRAGAPTRPLASGVVAGLVAGGIAATFYAAHCTDDSPLFVATFYTLAIAMLATLGGIAGRLVARW
jgi:hypothetical protein